MGQINHQHQIEFVQWQGPSHVHRYALRTTVNDRHSHRMRGTTSGAIDSIDSHVHYYEGTTTFNDGHVHRFSGYTGPAIRLPNGLHIHEFWGQTTFDDGHVHYFRGRTTPQIDVR